MGFPCLSEKVCYKLPFLLIKTVIDEENGPIKKNTPSPFWIFMDKTTDFLPRVRRAAGQKAQSGPKKARKGRQG